RVFVYTGSFSRADIDSMLETRAGNCLGWSIKNAPAIIRAPVQPVWAGVRANRFWRIAPGIAAHFARVTFLSDHRADLPKLRAPVLVLQCSDDIIAPRPVGDYLQRTLPNAPLRIIENVGHCPHLSAPSASMAALDEFLAALPLHDRVRA